VRCPLRRIVRTRETSQDDHETRGNIRTPLQKHAAKCGLGCGWLDLKRRSKPSKDIGYRHILKRLATMVRQVFPERTFYHESQLASSVRDKCPSRRPMRLGARHRRLLATAGPCRPRCVLVRLLTTIASPRDKMGSERPRCVPVVALLAAI
jgi:hypothetical protein